jgi:hypothetical protein
MVSLKVGFEFEATLLLYVNRFVPKQKDLLDHISFRIASDNPLDRSPTEPWGLHEYRVSYPLLDDFLDRIIQEILKNRSRENRNPLLSSVLQLAYARSLQSDQIDVCIDILRPSNLIEYTG